MPDLAERNNPHFERGLRNIAEHEARRQGRLFSA